MSHDKSQDSPLEAPDRQNWVQFADIANGLAYLHTRINANAGRTLESAAFVYALIDLLVETGLITVEQIDDHKQQFVDRLLQRYRQHDSGIALQELNQDKYTFAQTAKIDCENRVHLCKAACCKMVFPLSRQDIEEGVIRWELDKLYVIEGADGYCHHLDRTCLGCQVHAQRPIPCRALRLSERHAHLARFRPVRDQSKAEQPQLAPQHNSRRTGTPGGSG